MQAAGRKRVWGETRNQISPAFEESDGEKSQIARNEGEAIPNALPRKESSSRTRKERERTPNQLPRSCNKICRRSSGGKVGWANSGGSKLGMERQKGKIKACGVTASHVTGGKEWFRAQS